MQRLRFVHWNRDDAEERASRLHALGRGPGMAGGFVDFKVCAVDETWCGLRFKRRSA